MAVTYAEVSSLYERHLNPAFVRLLDTLGYGRLFTRAEGAWIHDSEGRRYLDLISGYGVFALGHNPPLLVEAVRRVLDESACQFLHVGPSEAAATLAAQLSEITGGRLPRCVFTTSGSEAVESAMKLAMAATGRHRFVRARGGYHGLGLGSLALLGDERLRGPFEAALPKATEVEFGSLPELGHALAAGDIAAFVVEPVLGEGGVVVPPPGYLDEARDLCAKHGALFVVDEVQTGLGRCGEMLLSNEMRSAPDAVVLAKALGGGVASIAALLAGDVVYRKVFATAERMDTVGSTFAGGHLACRVASETLRALADEGLVERSRELGEKLLAFLRDGLAEHPFVRAVRGRGLLVGIEIGPTDRALLGRLAPGCVESASRQAFGQWLCVRLLEEGVLAQTASLRWDVLKIEPPLNVPEEDLFAAAGTVVRVLREHASFAAFAGRIALRAGARAGGRLLRPGGAP